MVTSAELICQPERVQTEMQLAEEEVIALSAPKH
jgi:hypothetical protein